ncbi:MAG: hypothetical protein WDO68_31975 [Gammaproteobacteria bacterium]
MNVAENLESHPVRAISFNAFPFEEQETFRWLCKQSMKNPDDFRVEGEEHAPDPGSSRVHRDVVVVYLPNGKGRCYCPDFGSSWIVKFCDDLDVHYFGSRQDAEPRGIVVWS